MKSLLLNIICLPGMTLLSLMNPILKEVEEEDKEEDKEEEEAAEEEATIIGR